MTNELRACWKHFLQSLSDLNRAFWHASAGLRYRIDLAYAVPEGGPPKVMTILSRSADFPEILNLNIGSPSPWPATHPGVLVRWDARPL